MAIQFLTLCRAFFYDLFMMTSASAVYSALLDHFKPHRAEALYRIRVNGVCLVTGILLTYILPIPSLHKAISLVRGYPEVEHGSGEGIYRWFCISGVFWSPFRFHHLLTSFGRSRSSRPLLSQLSSWNICRELSP